MSARALCVSVAGLERNADRPEGKYDANVKFYDEARVDLSAIRVRAAALPKNEITLKQIDLLIDSVGKLEPPEPDIACEFTAIRDQVAFELVEIIDQGFARLRSNQSRDMDSLQEAYGRAREELRAALDERLGNAIISIAFVHGLPSRERQASIPVVLDQLATLDPAYVGEWRPPRDSPLRHKVWYIRITRGQSQGSEFHVDANTSIGDPTVERVRAKWYKTYKTQYPIELLAHYGLQPVTPDAMWLPELTSSVEANWATAPFRRVWLFESWSKKIRYTAVRPGNI